VIPEACRQAFEPARRQGEEAMAPLIAVLSAAADRLRQIAGGQ
jgi:hypothetical protein